MQSRFKKLIRKVDRIDYTNTDFPTEYEKIQKDYRIVKKKLEMIKQNFIKLMSYEHGGKSYKATMKAIELVGKKIRPDMYELKSFFRELEEGLSQISEIESNDKLKKVCSDYSRAYASIEARKIALNDELEKNVKNIQILQEKVYKIDEARANVLNIRYDLEKMYKKRDPQDPVLADKKNEFQSQASITKEDMQSFIDDPTLLSILTSSAQVQADFYKSAAEDMKSIK